MDHQVAPEIEATKCRLLVGIALSVSVLALAASPAVARDIHKGADDAVVERGETVGEVAVLNGDVTVNGTVTDDVSVLNGDVTLGPGARVNESINLANGEIRLARDATVGGDLNVANGDIVIERGGVVSGDVRILSGEIEAPPGAVLGEEVAGSGIWGEFDIDLNFGFGGWLAVTIAALIITALLTAAFPGLFVVFRTRLNERAWISGLVGLSGIIWIPVTILILVITVVGILVLPFWIGALLVGWGLGWLGAAYCIGSLVLSQSTSVRGQVMIATLLAVLALRLVELVPIAGPILNFLIALFGFGALALIVIGQRGTASQPAAAS